MVRNTRFGFINGWQKKVNTDFIVFAILLLMGVIYYAPFISKAPQNTHLWRQTDCLSITENYYKGAPFLSPQLHILLGHDHTTGKSAGELPIIYYSVSLIWKVFGPSYFSYRLFTALILFAGLIAFYKTLSLIFQDKFWSAFLVLLFFTSPVLVTYGASFLTDVPAFSFALMAVYAFVRYRTEGLKSMFWWSMLLFALAGLLKVSSLIIFVFLGFIYLLELMSVKTINGHKIFQKPRIEWIGFALVVAINFAWYAYANYYNNLSNFRYTFNSIYPIWTNTAPELDTLWDDLLLYIKPVFFSRTVLALIFFMGTFNMFLPKKIPLIAYLANLILIIGAASYFVLWGPLMGIHDYYYVAMLILFPATFLPFIYYLKTNYPSIVSALPVRFLAIFLLLMSFAYCYEVVQLKTGKKQGKFLVLNNKAFADIMFYFNRDRDENLGRFERIRPYLKELGIAEEDKMISLPDDSFSISLYFMGQKGWTNREYYDSSEDITKLIRKGAKYLMLSDEKLQSEEFLEPFLSQKIGDFEGIAIYKL
jgi:4-amino-4-deoxy-L-arabinose transferase-like glycosyltransferase